jgi:hypothetical protein
MKKFIKFSIHSRVFDYILLIVILIIGGWVVFELRQPAVIETGDPIFWILLVLVGFLGGYLLIRMDAWLPEGSSLPRLMEPGSVVRQRQGLVCLGIAALLTTWVVVKLWPDYHQWNGTFLPWLGALFLVVIGGILIGSQNKSDKPIHSNPSTKVSIGSADFKIPLWVEIGAFLGIAALAIFLRVYKLNQIPAGIYVDETNGGLDALGILQGNHASPFATGWYGTPNGYIYYMALLIKWFGANYYTLKAISLIPAILTVIAIYPLGREMFGQIGGLSAMLLLAVSRWHLSMSRWGWNEVAVPLFQILAIFFLIRGLRKRSLIDFMVGGLISGLMLYIYLSSRLAIATIGVFIIYWILTDPSGVKQSYKRNRAGIALFAFAGIVAFAPLAVTHITDPFTFTNRVDEISIFRDIKAAGNLQPLWQNIEDQLRFFHQVGDHQGKHNLPDEPETDPFTGLLFVIGLGYGLFRLHDRRRGLLWFWLLFGLAGGVFSSHSESPQSYRTLTALPAVVLFAADILSRILRGGFRVIPAGLLTKVQRVSAFSFKALGVTFFACGLVGSAVWESTTFFGRQANSLDYQAGFNLTENGVAHEVIDALKAGIPVYLSPSFYDYSQVRFLVYGYVMQETGKNALDDRPYYMIRPEDMLPIANPGKDAIFLLDTTYSSEMDYFRFYYPDIQVEEVYWAGVLPLYIQARVPEADFANIEGLNFRATTMDGTLHEGTAVNFTAPASTSKLSRIEWSGSIQLNQSGTYGFASIGNLQITLDGQPWTGDRILCSGLHQIDIVQKSPQGNTPAQLLWTLPNSQENMVPPQVLFHIPIPQNGLTGYYYQGINWQGASICVKNTPFLQLAWPDQEPIPGQFSAKFKGYLKVTEPGEYRLIINADDGARLTLDGKVIGEGLIANQPNYFEATVNLSAGDHPIQIDYFQAGGGSALNFNWQPPGQAETAVPFQALIPENEYISH